MKNIRKLLAYLTPYRSKIAGYFISSLLGVFFSIFTFAMLTPVLQVIFVGVETIPANSNSFVAQMTQTMNKIVLEQSRERALLAAVGIVIIATILKNAFVYLSLRILNPLRNNVIRAIRTDMFSKALVLPISYFNEERKGDLMSRMTNDVQEVENSIMSVIETVIREPLAILLTLATMIAISPELTLFLLLFLPLAGFLIGRVGKSLKKPSNAAQEQLGDMMSNVDETLSGIRIVKGFNAEHQQLHKFNTINDTIFRLKNKISARRDAGSPMSETLGVIVVGIILLYGGFLIFNGQSAMTGAAFIAYIALFYSIINPLKNLSSAFYNISKGSAALDRIQDFLAVDNPIREKSDAREIETFRDRIELRNIVFKYGDKVILDNISLTIPKGKTVALVGASGSGKSTLADLIPRFHDVYSGEILIDGINIKDLKIRSLRSLMGIVTQEAILFNDTISNNIVLGTTQTVDPEQVAHAARIANAYDYIMKKEQAFDTNIGERGGKLSGGERQRLTIARAVYKNPPVLILDEATSALDTASERLVQNAINKLMENRTSIVIAHRLSTVQHADEIIVMHEGKIAERGTHTELMAREGLYYNLIQMQQL
ncbi:MAG: antibiotic ABC transporter ATP-binding protein [Bacteroidetes bacterium 47-18]|nr:MAG: antibiotic ABC transporter ATP-binding protein [Bacteroidetes bacterium 47-18]